MKLKPHGANQTSLELSDGTVILFSYETPVAAFLPGRGYRRTAQYWSRTTSKHVSQWLAREDAKDVCLESQEFFNALAKGRAV
jgi:hypothetical protein